MKLLNISQNKPLHRNLFSDIEERLVTWHSINGVISSQNSSALINIPTD
jgi:hypothetical protein